MRRADAIVVGSGPNGLAAADYAVGLGCRAGARKVVLFHHRPDRTDEALDGLVARFSTYPVSVCGAADGMELAP